MTLLELGPSFSLDAVAARAGVSKGGLLHHFPSREALLLALASDLNGQFKDRVQTAFEQEPNAPGAWARAYITATFTENALEMQLIQRLAPALTGLSVLRGLEAEQQFFLRRCEQDGLPLGRAQAVRLACEGFWAGQMLESTSLDAASREALKVELLRLTRW